jgi:superfamily I DNA/RNA helicase
VIGFRNAEAEAHGIAAEIQRRHAEGLQWEDFAILEMVPESWTGS